MNIFNEYTILHSSNSIQKKNFLQETAAARSANNSRIVSEGTSATSDINSNIRSSGQATADIPGFINKQQQQERKQQQDC
jgi:hypothetical protein